jgi:hypothetical protein
MPVVVEKDIESVQEQGGGLRGRKRQVTKKNCMMKSFVILNP